MRYDKKKTPFFFTFKGLSNSPTFQYLNFSFHRHFKPKGGGRGEPPASVGHLNSIAFSTLGNLTKNLGPRVGTFAF